jgi:hypothetical protein
MNRTAVEWEGTDFFPRTELTMSDGPFDGMVSVTIGREYVKDNHKPIIHRKKTKEYIWAVDGFHLPKGEMRAFLTDALAALEMET